MGEPVDDKSLIIWFKDNYDKIPFIDLAKYDIERIKRSETLKTDIKKLDKNQPLHEQKETLKPIWKNLVANAIIYLKLKDEREKHHDDGDYGIDELANFFEEYCDFEKLLYGSSDYYRDHVSHVFKVFLLGEYLVRKKLGGFSSIDVFDKEINISPETASNKYEEEKERKTKKYTVSEEEKEAMWCVVSLTHDLGYPTEVMYKIPEKMRKMLSTFNIDVSYNASQQSQIYNDYILKLLSSDLQSHKVSTTDGFKVCFTTHIQSKYYSKYSRSLEKWDHGIETCVLLAKTLVYFLEMDCSLDKMRMMDTLDARQFLIRQRILRAIASHNCDYIYHLKLDMSFLLRIIDEMQEWGRPKLSDLFSTTPISSLEINQFTQDSINYKINFYYESNTSQSVNKKEAHKSVKEYFKRKVNLYTMILRSAVDGKNRNFTLEFSVVDEIQSAKEVTYKFIHPTPQETKIILKHTNAKNQDLETEIDMPDLEDKNWDDFYKEYFYFEHE